MSEFSISGRFDGACRREAARRCSAAEVRLEGLAAGEPQVTMAEGGRTRGERADAARSCGAPCFAAAAGPAFNIVT